MGRTDDFPHPQRRGNEERSRFAGSARARQCRTCAKYLHKRRGASLHAAQVRGQRPSSRTVNTRIFAYRAPDRKSDLRRWAVRCPMLDEGGVKPSPRRGSIMVGVRQRSCGATRAAVWLLAPAARRRHIVLDQVSSMKVSRRGSTPAASDVIVGADARHCQAPVQVRAALF
jgi:hypothetical protein